jgi:antitoxin component HigA of HigAB toxin-antitoxin module
VEVKPIRSDSDYERALRRVEALWGSPAGSPQGDELEVLVTLIEAYEREHYPIDLQRRAGGDNPERSIEELEHLSGRAILAVGASTGTKCMSASSSSYRSVLGHGRRRF